MTNYGPVASGASVLVDLTNALPPGVQLDSVSATAGSFNEGTGYWTVATLAKGESQTLTLIFSVNASAPDSEKISTGVYAQPTGDFTIDSDSSNDNGTLTTNVQGSGIPQTVGVSPLAKDFGYQRIGATSAPQTFTITNDGGTSLHVYDATISGPDAARYAISSTDCHGADLGVGQSCTVQVTFTPVTTNPITTAYLEITSDAALPKMDVVLHGRGTTAAVSTSPSGKVFGNQAVGGTSAAQTFTITNSSGADLTHLVVAVAGSDANQCAVTGGTCPPTLPVNSSCSIDVAFRPTTSGSHNSAMLSVASDDPFGSVQLPLSGTGVAPAVSISPASTAFGSKRVGTSSQAQTFTVTNTGNSPLTISAVTLGGGADASQYVVSNNTCIKTLDAGTGTCTVDVAFAPTTGGTHAATLDIASDDPAGAGACRSQASGSHPSCRRR